MSRIRKLIAANRGFLIFALTFGFIRTAVADYNPIPSSSMHPTIVEGDVVLVNRLAYSVKVPLTDVVIARTGEPSRGDIVTFSSPANGTRLIKRVIGLPGDVVAMRDKHLFINGQAVPYSAIPGAPEEQIGGREWSAQRLEEDLGSLVHEIQWINGMSLAADFGPIAIPRDQYLMLGDNRDNSADSRFIGLVDRRLLIGRAERVLVSANILDHWQPRFSRFGRDLYR